MPAAVVTVPVTIDHTGLEQIYVQGEDVAPLAPHELLPHGTPLNQPLGAVRERRRTASMARSVIVASFMFSWNSGTYDQPRTLLG